jgi:hypothetical protein
LGSDLTAHFTIRHRVFVNEQGVMVFTDVDHWNPHAQVMHVRAARGRSCAGYGGVFPYLGLPHQPMVFDLSKAGPLDWPRCPDLLTLDPLVEVGNELLSPA